jgi:hypothetical protein
MLSELDAAVDVTVSTTESAALLSIPDMPAAMAIGFTSKGLNVEGPANQLEALDGRARALVSAGDEDVGVLSSDIAPPSSACSASSFWLAMIRSMCSLTSLYSTSIGLQEKEKKKKVFLWLTG